MGQAKNRKAEIAALKQQTRVSYPDAILSLVSLSAARALADGIKLTNEDLIFEDANTFVYESVALTLLYKQFPYSDLLTALEMHDKLVKSETGVDLASFNGDMTMFLDYSKYLTEKKKLPAQRLYEVAILDGVNGFYQMRGLAH
jgi:hypothetical protein